MNGWANWETWHFMTWHENELIERWNQTFELETMLDGRGVPPNKYLSLRERVAVLLAEDIEVYIDDWYSKDVKDGWIHDVVYGYVGSLNKYEIANRCLEVIEESQNIKLPS